MGASWLMRSPVLEWPHWAQHDVDRLGQPTVEDDFRAFGRARAKAGARRGNERRRGGEAGNGKDGSQGRQIPKATATPRSGIWSRQESMPRCSYCKGIFVSQRVLSSSISFTTATSHFRP